MASDMEDALLLALFLQVARYAVKVQVYDLKWSRTRNSVFKDSDVHARMRCAVSGRPTRRDVDAGSFFSEKGNKTPLVDDSDRNGKILDFWHFDNILKVRQRCHSRAQDWISDVPKKFAGEGSGYGFQACNVVDGVVVLELPYNIDEEEEEEEEEEDQEEKSKQEGGANTVPDEKQEEEEEVGDDRILVKEGTESEQKFVHLRYISVGFERINIQTLMRECMELIVLDAKLLDPVVFGWRYKLLNASQQPRDLNRKREKLKTKKIYGEFRARGLSFLESQGLSRVTNTWHMCLAGRGDVDAGSIFSEESSNERTLGDDIDPHQFVACSGKMLDFLRALPFSGAVPDP
ncbi:hypothetical protein SELMODRAFT_428648 [Selaginella moellendorffii]|uniref:Uncharacterized protein n=1 Tax=Selaginella moellendorffii TaxID=88036 RepID=D8T3K1_SELML|nr:hypothetical protein SELMODRAFT_428648 [Selaginella moellendorffii]